MTTGRAAQTAPEEAAPAQAAMTRWMRGSGGWVLREGWVALVIVALVIGFTLISPNFASRANWVNTSVTATEVLLLALGQTFVIISAGIDLSVGAVLGLSGMAGGWVMAQLFIGGGTAAGLVVAAGFATALAVGSAIGWFNGWLIGYHNIPAFVVTLGTLGIATGLARVINDGLEISKIPPWVGQFGNTKLFGGWLPVPVLIAAALCVVTGIVLAKTRFGAYTYAVGDNKDAAIRAGIPHRRHLVKIYAATGLLAGIDGVLVMSRLDAASPASGKADNLTSIAAVVIGGASLFGGRGKIIGSILGTLLISVLLTGLIIIDVPPFWQKVAVGIVLIAAVAIDQYSERVRSRR